MQLLMHRGKLALAALCLLAVGLMRDNEFVGELWDFGATGKLRQAWWFLPSSSCPQDCFKSYAGGSESVGSGGCAALPDECQICVFCRWKEANACPGSRAPKAFESATCAAGAPAPAQRISGEDFTCPESFKGEKPSQMQLQGPIIDLVWEHLCLARWRKASRNVPAVAHALFFSLGYDSPMWVEMNANGSTEFVEDSQAWINMQAEDIKSRSHHVTYSTAMIEAPSLLCNTDRLNKFLTAELPLKLVNQCWDLIFVDAPMGFGWHRADGSYQPGRMQSIWAAAQLAGPETLVIVDDCQRRVESAYTLQHLSPPGTEIKAVSNGHGGYSCLITKSK